MSPIFISHSPPQSDSLIKERLIAEGALLQVELVLEHVVLDAQEESMFAVERLVHGAALKEKAKWLQSLLPIDVQNCLHEKQEPS